MCIILDEIKYQVQIRIIGCHLCDIWCGEAEQLERNENGWIQENVCVKFFIEMPDIRYHRHDQVKVR